MTPDMYINAFNETAKSFHDFATIIVEWIDKRRERKEENREARWNGLVEAADKTRKLVIHHRDMIRKAADPILDSGDIICAAQLIDNVVNDDKLPDSYGYLKGAIRQYRQMTAFSKESRELMGNLLGRVRAFQMAAFMIPPQFDLSTAENTTDTLGKGPLPSGNKLDAIRKAVELVELLKKPERDAGYVWGYSGHVLSELAGISESQYNVTPNLGFETPEEVTDFVRLFVENWLQNVRLQINLGRGVHAWVAAIEAQRHNRQTDP